MAQSVGAKAGQGAGPGSGHEPREWTKVRERLRAEYGEGTFRSWFKLISYGDTRSGTMIFSVPTRFMRDWVKSNYADRILALLAAENPDIKAIDLVVGKVTPALPMQAPVPPPAPRAPLTRPGGPQLRTSETADAVEPGPQGDRLDPTTGLDARFTFQNFVVGKPNELAFHAARRVAESTTVPFNPLFLYGGVGLGKTHLMHAIAWTILERHPSRRVLYLSAEKFMYQFIRALRYKDTMAFKEQFRSVDVLMIDDVQFISGKDSTQEEFFHTFNALVDQNRQVVISADKSPSDLEGLEERLRSRLGWGLVADLHPTTYELRLGILQSKAENQGVRVPSKVLEFLAHKITSNVRELEGALTRIIAHATLVGREISLESTQELLQDLLRANDRRVTIEEIQKRVAEHFNIRVADMHSARRARAVARPRPVAM